MSFKFLFYKNIFARKSCAKCPYTNLRRPSDITIADFWGWEKTNPEFNKDDRGISLIFCNTERGRELFEKACADMDVFPAKIEDTIQPNLEHPSSEHPSRDKFEHEYVKHGFEYVYFKYGEEGWRYKLSRPFKRIWKRIKAKLK